MPTPPTALLRRGFLIQGAGNAGSADTGVVTVQGIAGGTALIISGDVNVAAWGGVATSLGQKVMASSVPVVIASNQSNVPTNQVQWGGVNVDGAVTPGFGVTNPTGAPWVYALNAGRNDSNTLDTLRSGANNADGVGVSTNGILRVTAVLAGVSTAVASTLDRIDGGSDASDAQGTTSNQNALKTLARNTGWNGASWDRLKSGDDNTDGQATNAVGILKSLARNFVYDPIDGTWDRALGDGSSLAAVVRGRMSPTWQVANGAANTATTLTIAASGAGLFHAITYIHIARVATAALAGGAILAVTTTNLTGAPQWRTGNLMVAGGYTVLIDQNFGASPLRSAAANTATTIVAPAAGAAVSWQITVAYFDTTSQR